MPKHLVNAAMGLFLWLWGGSALAAVANQSCVPTVGSTTGQHFAANTTFSLTNVTVSAGSNLALTVQVFFDTNSAVSVSSIVWDQAGANQSLSQVNAGGGAVGRNVETWALINPTPGTNKTVSITIGSSAAIFAAACAWTGVDQTGGATSFPHTQNGTNPVTTVTITSAAGNMVLGGGTNGLTIGTVTGTTVFSDSVNGGTISAFANFDNGAASVVIGDSNNLDVMSATDIKAAAGGGGCTRHSLALTGAGC